MKNALNYNYNSYEKEDRKKNTKNKIKKFILTQCLQKVIQEDFTYCPSQLESFSNEIRLKKIWTMPFTFQSLSLSFCQFRLSKKHLKGESRLPGMKTNDAKNWNPIYKNFKRKKMSNLKIALANNKE